MKQAGDETNQPVSCVVYPNLSQDNNFQCKKHAACVESEGKNGRKYETKWFDRYTSGIRPLWYPFTETGNFGSTHLRYAFNWITIWPVEASILTKSALKLIFLPSF